MILPSEIHPCPLMRTFTYHDCLAVLLNALTLPALAEKVRFVNLMQTQEDQALISFTIDAEKNIIIVPFSET